MAIVRNSAMRGCASSRVLTTSIASALGPNRLAAQCHFGAIALPRYCRFNAPHRTLRAEVLMRTLSLADAVALIPDGASLMIGGFMAVGMPENVVDELARQSKLDLTVICNDNAMPGICIGKLVRARLV